MSQDALYVGLQCWMLRKCDGTLKVIRAYGPKPERNDLQGYLNLHHPRAWWVGPDLRIHTLNGGVENGVEFSIGLILSRELHETMSEEARANGEEPYRWRVPDIGQAGQKRSKKVKKATPRERRPEV